MIELCGLLLDCLVCILGFVVCSFTFIGISFGFGLNFGYVCWFWDCVFDLLD